MFTDPFGLQADTIDVQTHKVLLGASHASIRITPDNQERWKDDPRFLRDSQGRAYLTLGAGPEMRNGSLTLVSDLNRPADAAPHVMGPVVASGSGEDAIIEALLEADAAYGDDLPYALFPLGGAGAYNSNGYVSGLLKAAGLPAPVLPATVPGYGHPVPSSNYSR